MDFAYRFVNDLCACLLECILSILVCITSGWCSDPTHTVLAHLLVGIVYHVAIQMTFRRS